MRCYVGCIDFNLRHCFREVYGTRHTYCVLCTISFFSSQIFQINRAHRSVQVYIVISPRMLHCPPVSQIQKEHRHPDSSHPSTSFVHLIFICSHELKPEQNIISKIFQVEICSLYRDNYRNKIMPITSIRHLMSRN